MKKDVENSRGVSSFLQLTLLAWLTMLGFDLLLHGGLLARLYLRADTFLLSPEEAFRRIPFGYAGFLLLAVLLVWLILRLRIRTWRHGLGFGLALGGAIWTSLALGLYSITPAKPDLLVAWMIGQTLEMGLAGLVLGLRMQRYSFGRMLILVLLGVLILFACTVALQSTGLAPTIRTG